jgi:cysteine desulfurase
VKVYLDNAATTPLDPQVFEAMKPFMLEDFGNPSSTHSHGRKIKTAIESSRKKIAELLNCRAGEIIFTSGGTEADNTIINGAVKTYGIQTIITSPIEHHAVIHTIEQLVKTENIQLRLLDVDPKGNINFGQLEDLLRKNSNALVSLMQANNEIGNILDIEYVGELCEKHNAYFHSDTVQSVAHYKHDLKQIKLHGMAASAHKFHGPKGVGFMFIRHDKKLSPYLHGGSQERNMRGGTENVYGIIGLTKALEIAYTHMDEHTRYIKSLKAGMIEKLKETIPGVSFHGNSADLEKSLYTVLNVSLPESDENDMLLFNLDLQGISASGGSACSSGATLGSHVLSTLDHGSKRGAIRFSFSKYNTEEEVDFVVTKLKELCKVSVPDT